MDTQIFCSKEDLVKDIVLSFPRTSDYFRQKKIDFCCGGNRPLAAAVAERGLDVEQVLEELTQWIQKHPTPSDAESWQQADSAELIAHIIQKHHQFLRDELPELERYVHKIARVHGEHDPHLIDMAGLYTKLKHELLEHTQKEEAEVFPRMNEYQASGQQTVWDELKKQIQLLESEHDGAGDVLRQLRDYSKDYSLPAHACTTYRVAFSRLEQLEIMTFEHVHLENNILFPRYLK